MFSCVDFMNLFYNMAVIVLYFFLYNQLSHYAIILEFAVPIWYYFVDCMYATLHTAICLIYFSICISVDCRL